MLRLLLTGFTALALTSASQADDVRDVLLLPGGQEVWIALDGAPSRLEAQAAPGRLVLSLAGFAPEDARDIRLRDGGPLESLTLTAGGQLVLSGAFSLARPELREGGVLIRFGEGPAYLAAAEAAEAPRVYQIGEPQPLERAPLEARPVEAADARARPAPGAMPTAFAPPEPALNADPDLAAAATEAGAQAGPPVEEVEAAPGPCDATAAIIASTPWDLDALARHAACLAEIGQRDNAAGLYERVLAFEPGHFEAALGLARLREAQGRRADAARLFEAAAGSARTDGQALAARQSAARLRGDDG